MGSPTGRPRGRPAGSKNKRTEAAIEAGRKAVEAALADVDAPFDGDAHALLVSVYRNPTFPILLRVDAAKSAMTREKPALAAIDVTSLNEHVVHTVRDEPLSLDEWAAQADTAH